MRKTSAILILFSLISVFVVGSSIYNTWQIDMEMESHIVTNLSGLGNQINVTTEIIANHSYLVRVGLSDEGGETAVVEGYFTILLDGVEVKSDTLYNYAYDDTDEQENRAEASAFAQLYHWIHPESNQTLTIIGEKYRGDTWFFTLYEDVPEHLLGDRIFYALTLGSGMFMLVIAFVGFVALEIAKKHRAKEKEKQREQDSELGVEYYE